MTKRYILFLYFCCAVLASRAQDPVFSQFYASPLQLNPAFAGVAYAPFIALNYRSQYPTFGTAFTTYAISYDQYFDGIKSGIGLSIMGDNAGNGIYTKNYVDLHYSYRVDLTRDIAAKFGIEAGIIQSRLDWDKLVFYDQLDPLYGSTRPDGTVNPSAEKRPDNLSTTVIDVSTGILVYGAGFHAGLAVQHLNTPNEGLLNINPSFIIGLPSRWTLHGGYEYELEPASRNRLSSYISPVALFTKQGAFKQVNVGVSVALGPLLAGGFFRHTLSNSDAAQLMLGFRQESFKFAYSYDLTLSALSGKTGGSHEVSFSINLDPEAGKRLDINDCFKMFR